MFDLDTKKVFVSRDVVFVENSFPMSSSPLQHKSVTDILEFGNEVENEHNPGNTQEGLATNIDGIALGSREEVEPNTQLENTIVEYVPAVVTTSDEIEQTAHQEEGVDDDDDVEAPDVQIEELGPGKRTTYLPVRLKDYVLQVVCDTNTDTGDCDEGIDFPISKYIDCNKFSPKYRAFLAAVIAGTEPTTF